MKATIIINIILGLALGLYIYHLDTTIKEHEEVINRQGTIITFMLTAPEIQSVLDRQLKRAASSTPNQVTK